MNKLDALWKYQQAELSVEKLENRLKSTPSRQKLNKLHAFLTEQQNTINTIQKNIDARKAAVEKIAAQVKELEHKYELEVSEFEIMENDDECTAAELTESRVAIQALMANMESAR